MLLRTSWAYAGRGKNFLLVILKRALEGQALKVVDDQFGAPTSTRFVAEGTSQLLAKAVHARATDGKRRFSEVTSLVCSGTTTWYGFACRAVEALEKYCDRRRVYVGRTSPPLLLYWISRMWVKAHRGLMHDDPVLFALRDPVSLASGAMFLGVLWLATLSL